MMWGSCFVENIGALLTNNKFVCNINPFGILYNPASIAEALRTLMQGGEYTESNLRCDKGIWYSLMHHSSFSSSNKEECLRLINTRIHSGRSFLADANWLIITLGTSRVYEWKENGKIVGNCHKLPERMFTRRLLEVDEIVLEYRELLKQLSGYNPKIRILFTVSPIRHAKDGMHGNQINKATLLLAIDKICHEFDFCHYFPSYEIMMDDLRDYRFYADDMLHPSPMAVNYIWQCLKESCFSKETLRAINEWKEIEKGLSHKPFNPDSEAYHDFVSQILLKIERMKENFPYLDIQKEIDICQALLKK